MKRLLFILILATVAYSGFGQKLPANLNDKDSILVTGKILGFKSGEHESFVKIITFDVTGERHNQAVQVGADGSFVASVFQPFAGDIELNYKNAYVSAVAKPGGKLQLEIDTQKMGQEGSYTDAFFCQGDLADFNNLFLKFQNEFRRKDFVTKARLGDKLLSDSAFSVLRLKLLNEQLEFLDSFMRVSKFQHEDFTKWEKNQLVYTAAREILLHPFFGKLNKTISHETLQGLIGFIPIENAEAFNNSAYYEFLKGLSLGYLIMLGINTEYASLKEEKGNSPVTGCLPLIDKVSDGLIKQLMYYDVYASQFDARARGNVVTDAAFSSVIVNPVLRNKFDKLSESINRGFESFHIISRIRESKASDSLKVNLIRIFENLEGKNLFIDFWGDWCAPCMMEMPNYPKLISSFEGKPIRFLFLLVKTKEQSVQRVKDKYNIDGDFINLTNDETAILNNVFRFYSYPSHFLVNSGGNVVGSHVKRADEIGKILAL